MANRRNALVDLMSKDAGDVLKHIFAPLVNVGLTSRDIADLRTY